MALDLTPNEMPWFALYVRSRHEKTVTEVLRNKGFATFLPLYSSIQVSGRRESAVSLPLFPGYVFCQFDPNGRRMPILTTPGVVYVVGLGGEPSAVDPLELDAIRAVMKSGMITEPWPFLTQGQRVRVTRGSLEGLTGVLMSFRKQDRLILSVSLLQRSVAVEIERAWVTPIKSPVSAGTTTLRAMGKSG